MSFANEDRAAVHDRAVHADVAHLEGIAGEDVVGKEHQVRGVARKKPPLRVFFEARIGASRRVAVDGLFDREFFGSVEAVGPAFGVALEVAAQGRRCSSVK